MVWLFGVAKIATPNMNATGFAKVWFDSFEDCDANDQSRTGAGEGTIVSQPLYSSLAPPDCSRAYQTGFVDIDQRVSL
jgi:hypothetical protein